MVSINELTNATRDIDRDKQVTFAEHERNIKRELNDKLNISNCFNNSL